MSQNPLYIKTIEDLSALFGSLWSVTKPEFMAFGLTEDNWFYWRKDPMQFLVVSDAETKTVLFNEVIKRANVKRQARRRAIP